MKNIKDYLEQMNNDSRYRLGSGNYIVVNSEIANYLLKIRKIQDRKEKLKRILD